MMILSVGRRSPNFSGKIRERRRQWSRPLLPVEPAGWEEESSI
jgi:hypothetical protein